MKRQKSQQETDPNGRAAVHKTILVLEDERPLLEIIQSKLETEDLSVIVARSVGQALGYLKEGVRVDAVWLDHYLFGEEDGLDFVTKLRRSDPGRELPVFVVSNTVSQKKVQQYLSLGVR